MNSHKVKHSNYYISKVAERIRSTVFQVQLEALLNESISPVYSLNVSVTAQLNLISSWGDNNIRWTQM